MPNYKCKVGFQIGYDFETEAADKEEAKKKFLDMAEKSLRDDGYSDEMGKCMVEKAVVEAEEIDITKP